MGVTHHSNYIKWMEEARIFFLDQLGWGYARLEGKPVILRRQYPELDRLLRELAEDGKPE